MGACGARVARGNHEEGDGKNHQELGMGGRAPPVVFGGAKIYARGVHRH